MVISRHFSEDAATGHLAIVDPAMGTAEIECFNALSLRTSFRTSYHLPGLRGMESFSSCGPVNCIIVLGSAASVHDAHPWQAPFHGWLEDHMRAGVPTLGICYGHQAIAHLFGGEVTYLWDGVKAKGTRDVKVDCDRLGLRDRGPAVVSHREGVTRCPDDFEVIVTSPEMPVDGIRHRVLPIWGVQPHMEAIPQFLANNAIIVETPQAAVDFGYGFIDAFLRYVERPRKD